MHLNFFPLLLIAAFDLILASPTLQGDDEIGLDSNLFSSEGSDPLNIGSLDIAFNPDLGDGSSGASSNIDDFHLDPNDDLNADLTTLSTLGLDGSLTGSEITFDNLNLLENPSSDIPLEIASCGNENEGVLRAREDGLSCQNGQTKAPVNLPLDLFRDSEAAIRRFFQKNSQTEPSMQVLPPSTSSDDSKKCPPDYPIRCCTNQVGEYSISPSLQVLYFISKVLCLPGMSIFSKSYTSNLIFTSPPSLNEEVLMIFAHSSG